MVAPAPSATAGATPGQAKRLAITAPVVAAGLAVVASFADPRLGISRSRVLAGMVVLMICLALLAEASPQLAAGFAWLVIITALFVTGEPVWNMVQTLTK